MESYTDDTAETTDSDTLVMTEQDIVTAIEQGLRDMAENNENDLWELARRQGLLRGSELEVFRPRAA